MKRTVLFVAFFLINFLVFAQSKVINKESSTLKNQGVTNLNAREMNTQITGLPDLKFTSLSVTATPSPADGADYYSLNITYTVKNDGKVAALADNINIQGYITNEYWLAKEPFNPALTGVFSAACGHVLSNISGKGETIAPGESKQKSYTCSSRRLPRNPKPVYIITINQYNSINESDYSNNRTQMTIPL